jgi:hypothetical protein
VDGDDRSCDVLAVDEVEGALRFECLEGGGNARDPVDGVAIVGLRKELRVSKAEKRRGKCRKRGKKGGKKLLTQSPDRFNTTVASCILNKSSSAIALAFVTS